jgi:hypothetical protein
LRQTIHPIHKYSTTHNAQRISIYLVHSSQQFFLSSLRIDTLLLCMCIIQLYSAYSKIHSLPFLFLFMVNLCCRTLYYNTKSHSLPLVYCTQKEE